MSNISIHILSTKSETISSTKRSFAAANTTNTTNNSVRVDTVSDSG